MLLQTIDQKVWYPINSMENIVNKITWLIDAISY